MYTMLLCYGFVHDVRCAVATSSINIKVEVNKLRYTMQFIAEVVYNVIYYLLAC